jgi:hypothetical protein
VNVPPEGECVTLDGDQALAFARSRHYETLVDERWETDGSGDLGRISRQKEFIRLALDRAIDRGARNPTTLQQFIDVGKDHVVLDDTLTTGDLLDLGNQLSDFDPDALRTHDLPVQGGSVGAASVLFLDEDEAQDELNVFRGVSNLIPTTAAIRVSVRNGSGVSGQATEVADDLRTAGFTVASATDADSFGNTRTTIRHGPDDLVLAVFLARFLDADVQFEQVESVGAASVELVTGLDYRGVLDEPLPLEVFAGALPAPSTEEPASSTRTDQLDGPTTTSSTVVGAVPDQPADARC